MAIRGAARKAAKFDSSKTVGDGIRQEYFHRFLNRIFSKTDDSEWFLKGGTGVLARVGSARATKDVDLLRENQSLEDALQDLKRLAEIDLGDFFRFEYTGYRQSVGDEQAYVEGYRVSFDTYLGASNRDTLNVDLVVNAVVTDEPTVKSPANKLDIPRLPSAEYRLYPVVDQITDKVCATLTEYRGMPSSRQRDLVDLVVLARSEDMNAAKLRRALFTEARVRGIALPEQFHVPSTWGLSYTREAKRVPACKGHESVELAMTLMSSFIDVVLQGEVTEENWDHEKCCWIHPQSK